MSDFYEEWASQFLTWSKASEAQRDAFEEMASEALTLARVARESQ